MQFADIKDAAVQGKGIGEAIHWNIYSDVATQGTTLTEGTAMPTTNFVITQGTMTVCADQCDARNDRVYYKWA